MGYAVFSLITGGITLVCVWVIGRKNMFRIISGFTFSKVDQMEALDKNLLKCFVVRMLSSVAALQFTAGIVCLLHLTAAVLIAQLVWMVLICLAGVLMYEFARKKECANIYVKVHSIMTIIFLVGGVATIVLLSMQ